MTESENKTQEPGGLGGLDGFEQMRAMVEGRIPPAPIAATLGMVDFEIPERGVAVVHLQPEARHYNPIGTVHGGVFATLLDSATGCAVHSTLTVGEAYTSLDLTVKFLRAVTVDSGLLRAEGRVIQRGRRTALAEAQLFDGSGRLVGHATSSCLILA